MRKQQLVSLIVVAGAALAGALPSAQAASVSPDDRALYRGSSATLAPKSLGADDRPFYRGSSATLAPKSVSPDDRAFARSVGGIEPTATPATVVSPSGFDWGDAIVGGTFGLAFALLGAGTIVIAVRHRRSPLRTA